MKIVVIGGTGLIGSKVVTKLNDAGHQAIAAAPNTGVNTITGEGLAEALAGAEVVIDLANSPTFEDEVAMQFFQTAGRNLIEAETAAGVRLFPGYFFARPQLETLPQPEWWRVG